MNPVLAISALLLLGTLVLLVALSLLALLWRHLPLSQRVSEALFTVLAVALCTPVPVGLGTGAMYYPIAILYTNRAQLEWHIGWYAHSPELVAPSILLTAAIAYFVSHKLLPNRSARAYAKTSSSSVKP